jgi:general secretion pathway protein F
MNFRYKAYLTDARQETGNIEASDKQDALRKLSRQGRAVFELDEAEAKKEKRSGIDQKPKSFAFMARKFNAAQLFSDLALLTDAGLTITQALRSMHSTEASAEQRKVIGELLASMSTGTSAATAFGSIKSVPLDSVGLIASGENAGRLAEVFRALTEQYEERAKLKSQLQNVLGYPIFLLILMVAAILVLTFALVPAIEPIFQNADRPPPLVVGLLSSLRGFLTGGFIVGGPVVILGLLLLVLMPAFRKRIRTSLHRLTGHLPIIGTIIVKTALARYLSSLALLLSNGTSMSKALALAATTVPNAALQAKLITVRDRVSTGERLPQALENSRLFDDRIVSLIAVGDEANRLAIVTKRASKILDSEAQTITTRLIAILTPTMTIALGLLIGGLVVSVMTALLSINEIAIQ